jgi:hypothetical protein
MLAMAGRFATMFRQFCAAVALAAAAGPAAADWVVTGDDARVTDGNRTLIVSCAGGERARLSVVPGPQRVEPGTEVLFGLVVDGDRARRIDVPMSCSPAGCAEIIAPRLFPAADAAALVARLRAGDRVDILLRNRVVESFNLRGSAAALSRLKAAFPDCRGL